MNTMALQRLRDLFLPGLRTLCRCFDAFPTPAQASDMPLQREGAAGHRVESRDRLGGPPLLNGKALIWQTR